MYVKYFTKSRMLDLPAQNQMLGSPPETGTEQRSRCIGQTRLWSWALGHWGYNILGCLLERQKKKKNHIFAEGGQRGNNKSGRCTTRGQVCPDGVVHVQPHKVDSSVVGNTENRHTEKQKETSRELKETTSFSTVLVLHTAFGRPHMRSCMLF